MPATVIDEKTVERSVDAQFAYTNLKKDENDGQWKGVEDGDTKKLESYDKINDDNDINFQILDHIKDSSSGFQATLIEKTDSSGNITKVISLAGMDIWEGEDRTAATSISQGEVPGLQYKAMTDFISKLIDNNQISQSDNITMVGHSLGGLLTQMATATFTGFIDNSYTFNSPGAANLTATAEQAESWGWSAETNLYFNEFIFNKYDVGDRITNFTAASGSTFIADEGEDIGMEFRLPGLWHGIAEMQDISLNIDNIIIFKKL